MNGYFTSLMEGWMENETWISQLTAREPIVYIAAGIFGILLFVGFIASIFAIIYAINHHSDTSSRRHAEVYQSGRNEAAKAVISALRSAGMPDAEIRETLMKEYGCNAVMVDSLMGQIK